VRRVIHSKKGKVFFIVPALFGLILSSCLLTGPEVLAGTATTSLSVTVSACGDNVVSGTEECDGSDLDGESCTSKGYDSGDLSCNADCAFDTSGCSTDGGNGGGGGGGGGGYAPRATSVILQGIAYPGASITVLVDGKVGTIIKAGAEATFKVTLTTLSAGTYTFGLWAEDSEGRKSITFSFTVNITSGRTTTVSNIFIPPTIELEKTNLLSGETLHILGSTAPESHIDIHVESSQEIVKEAEADEEGDWEYLFETGGMDEGYHTSRAKAESSGGLLSSFSKVLGFYIGKYESAEVCPRADFNKEGKTNLVDFSILLYWWGKYNPCVDQNQDSIVNLADFSILMYWWSG